MTTTELYELTTKLFECSQSMKEINMDCSNILLNMSTETLKLLEKAHISDDVKQEIEDIKSQILEGIDE